VICGSMDNDTDDELATLLLTSKSKIWEDKKRLGLLEKPVSCVPEIRYSQSKLYACLVVFHLLDNNKGSLSLQQFTLQVYLYL
jgi:hypothetical protein